MTIPIEELPIEPDVAIDQGYTESKWVSEAILEVARSQFGLHTVIVRVGQITGGVNGSWNTAEWMPSMVRSSLHLKCFPMVDGVCRFYHSVLFSFLTEYIGDIMGTS